MEGYRQFVNSEKPMEKTSEQYMNSMHQNISTNIK